MTSSGCSELISQGCLRASPWALEPRVTETLTKLVCTGDRVQVRVQPQHLEHAHENGETHLQGTLLKPKERRPGGADTCGHLGQRDGPTEAGKAYSRTELLGAAPHGW